MCTVKYNETEHTVTGFTPFYLMHGTDVTVLSDELKEKTSEQDWIHDKKMVLVNTKKSDNYNKQIYDKNRTNFEFNVGDMAFVENGNKLNRKNGTM